MNPKTKGYIFIPGFIICMIIFFVICSKISSSHEDSEDKQRKSIIGNVQFKGKVISSKIYSYAGKPYYMLCAHLEYATVQNFYVLNDLCAIKIKNNIATMSGTVYDPNVGFPTYVEVNLNRTGITKFYFKDGTTDQFESLLRANGLSDGDLDICDNAK